MSVCAFSVFVCVCVCVRMCGVCVCVCMHVCVCVCVCGIWDMGILFNLGKPLAQGLLPKAPSKQYKEKKSSKDRETKHNQNPHKSN